MRRKGALEFTKYIPKEILIILRVPTYQMNVIS